MCCLSEDGFTCQYLCSTLSSQGLEHLYVCCAHYLTACACLCDCRLAARSQQLLTPSALVSLYIFAVVRHVSPQGCICCPWQCCCPAGDLHIISQPSSAGIQLVRLSALADASVRCVELLSVPSALVCRHTVAHLYVCICRHYDVGAVHRPARIQRPRQGCHHRQVGCSSFSVVVCHDMPGCSQQHALVLIALTHSS